MREVKQRRHEETGDEDRATKRSWAQDSRLRAQGLLLVSSDRTFAGVDRKQDMTLKPRALRLLRQRIVRRCSTIRLISSSLSSRVDIGGICPVPSRTIPSTSACPLIIGTSAGATAPLPSGPWHG